MKTMKKFNFIISNTGVITINVDGKIYSISKEHALYDTIREAIDQNDINTIIHSVDVKQHIANEFSGGITFKDGEILYKGIPIKNSLTKKIITFIERGLPFEPLVKFLENLVQNPAPYIINELDLFFEAGSFALTDDGHFLAYKRIRDNWMDYYSGTIDNSIGKEVIMKRSEVNSDRNTVCSFGLHVCNKEYLNSFHQGEGRIIIVKVNPRDVVSIPSDYNNKKMRCCRYVVIGEVKKQTTSEKDTEVIDSLLKGDLYTTDKKVKSVVGKKVPRRGPDGRFLKKTMPLRGADGKFIKMTAPVAKGPQRGPDGRFLKKQKSG